MASPRTRRRALIAAAAIGIGLAAAPVAFQMFARAPKGGDMITEFKPYMTQQKIGEFRGYLAEIDAAEQEARTYVQSDDPTAKTATAGHIASVQKFVKEWPTINADMSDMLTTMQRDIPRFKGVAALPPFPLFPWFFVLPGLLLAGFSIAALRSRKERSGSRKLTAVVVVLGLGLIAAPGIFQMFTRAPGGAAMINDFRPLMTPTKVTAVQGYFLTLGAGEGQLRTEVLPALDEAGVDTATRLPAVQRWSTDWPTISHEMAPMIGTMADNLDNYAAVDALPPFWLFPWFFALPGLIAVVLGFVAWRPRSTSALGNAVTSDRSGAERVAEGTQA